MFENYSLKWFREKITHTYIHAGREKEGEKEIEKRMRKKMW